MTETAPAARAELVLVRHGESLGNVADAHARRSGSDTVPIGERDADVDLSPLGVEQATAAGRRLAQVGRDHPVPALFSSPYLRARRTCDLALEAWGAPAEPPAVDERLRDRELGILDRLTALGVAHRHPDEDARRRHLGRMYYRPPGGESWADVALRLRSFVSDRLAVPPPFTVLFAHDAVIALLRYVLEDLDEARLMEITRSGLVGNGSLTRLALEPGARTWTFLGLETVDEGGTRCRATTA